MLEGARDVILEVNKSTFDQPSMVREDKQFAKAENVVTNPWVELTLEKRLARGKCPRSYQHTTMLRNQCPQRLTLVTLTRWCSPFSFGDSTQLSIILI